MSKLAYADLVMLAAKHGFPDPYLAAAVAEAESGGDPEVIGDTEPGVLGPSVGLWQVDIYFHKQWSQEALQDPDTNAQAAFSISAQGTNWRAWSTAWEDPVHKLGYLGPRSPAMRYYHPAPKAEAAAEEASSSPSPPASQSSGECVASEDPKPHENIEDTKS